MKKPVIALFDGNALIHRAYHALPPLSVNKTGEPVGAVYGFAQMLLKVLADIKPECCVIAFDRKEPTFRHELYKEYKAHRPPAPDDLVKQFSRVRQFAQVFNMPIYEKAGYEADDLIGSLSHIASEKGMEVVIVTGDADAMQLVTGSVKVLSPKPRGSFSDTIIYDEETVEEKFGVPPSLIADYKALVGDSSDNIPGVSGIGKKTAVDIINKYGSVEDIYSNIKEIKPERAQKLLKEGRQSAIESKRLAEIVTDLPLEIEVEEAKTGNYDREKVKEFFRELEFASLMNKIDGLDSALGGAGTAEACKPLLKPNYKLTSTTGALEELKKRLNGCSSFAFDTETTGLNPLEAGLVGISISPAEGEAYYIPVKATAPSTTMQMSFDSVSENGNKLPLEDVLGYLGQVFANGNIEKIAQNAKFDMEVLLEHGFTINGLNFDTMIAAYLLGEKSIGLKALAFSKLGIEMTQIEELIGKGVKQLSMADVEVEKVCDYACADADMTYRLRNTLEEQLKEEGFEKLFNEVEMPLVPVIMKMERAGISLNTGLLKELSVKLGEKLGSMEEEIYNHAGTTFNINSPKQLGPILFEKLNLPVLKKTKSGYSTDASVLDELKKTHPIINLILEYRTIAKLKSTYIDAFPGMVNPKTKRLHTSFNQTRTSTGRLSSSDPNLQNIPVRTELGREIRKAFTAPKGSVLLAADYSQIDLRALAHLSGDSALIESFENDEDIHSATAARINGIGAGEVTPNMRRFAKTINFGVIYGMSGYGLEQATELSRDEADKFIKGYFEKYAGVSRYLEEIKQTAREKGYVETILGRRRYIPGMNSTNRQARESAERMAINMPVQGTSADIIKVAMVKLDKEMSEKGLKSRMLLQVHDELIFEVPEEELNAMKEMVSRVMTSALKLKVPLKVGLKTGATWGNLE